MMARERCPVSVPCRGSGAVAPTTCHPGLHNCRVCRCLTPGAPHWLRGAMTTYASRMYVAAGGRCAVLWCAAAAAAELAGAHGPRKAPRQQSMPCGRRHGICMLYRWTTKWRGPRSLAEMTTHVIMSQPKNAPEGLWTIVFWQIVVELLHVITLSLGNKPQGQLPAKGVFAF